MAFSYREATRCLESVRVCVYSLSAVYMSQCARQWVHSRESYVSLNMRVCVRSLFLGTSQTECILGKDTSSAERAWFLESVLFLLSFCFSFPLLYSHYSFHSLMFPLIHCLTSSLSSSSSSSAALFEICSQSCKISHCFHLLTNCLWKQIDNLLLVTF